MRSLTFDTLLGTGILMCNLGEIKSELRKIIWDLGQIKLLFVFLMCDLWNSNKIIRKGRQKVGWHLCNYMISISL